MRIAVFHNLPSGGGKRSAHEWVKRMAKKHDVDLYLYDKTAENFLDMRPFVNQTFVIPGGEAGFASGIGRLAAFGKVKKASVNVANKINTGNYDLAFVMQCRISNSPFVLRHLEIPSLYFCQEPFLKALEFHNRVQDGNLRFVKQMYLRWLIRVDNINARHATLICANSLYSRENIYRAYGIYPRLNYLGVDTDQFCNRDLAREPVILSVGALHPAKGQDFIIESLGTLVNRPNVKFIYNFAYGYPHYRSELSRLAEKLNVSISFQNLPLQDDLVNAYNQATITAFPSRLEPLGLVPLESMACGTPVVGIAEAGIRETIQHGENGLLTERDPHEFGCAIETLLNDQALWLRMGEMGRQRVLERWTWDQSYQKLEEHMVIARKRYATQCNLSS